MNPIHDPARADVGAEQRVPRAISSAQTFFVKYLFPVFGALTAIRLIHDDWTFVVAVLPGGAFVYWSCNRLKRVAMDGRTLHISNYLREIVVPLEDVEEVTENRWLNIHPVTVRFRRENAFGRSVVFMPKVRIFAGFSSHPIVEELRAAAARATERERSGPRELERGGTVVGEEHSTNTRVARVLLHALVLPGAAVLLAGLGDRSLGVWLVCGVIVIAGPLTARSHVRLLLRHLFLGTWLVRSDTLPARLGGILQGEAVLEASAPTGPLTVTLSCVDRTVQRGGWAETVLWHASQPSSAEVSAASTVVPFSFRLPLDLPPSSAGLRRRHIVWRLEVRPSAGGGDAVAFLLPVMG